jgi:hypothetical protein
MKADPTTTIGAGTFLLYSSIINLRLGIVVLYNLFLLLLLVFHWFYQPNCS